MKRLWVPGAVLLHSLAVASASDRPTAHPKAEHADEAPGITGLQGDAILQELRAIRQLLERQGTPRSGAAAPIPARPSNARIQISTSASSMALGADNAPVTVVEYVDFQCSFCRRHQEQTLSALVERYVKTGKVRYVSRDLPLEMHGNALAAAQAGRCAAAQDRYWEMRRVLFANTSHLNPTEIPEHARSAGLDLPSFERCMRDKQIESAIRADAATARKLGISGTPTFVIGKTAAGVMDGVLLVGAQPLSSFEAKIIELIGQEPGAGEPR